MSQKRAEVGFKNSGLDGGREQHSSPDVMVQRSNIAMAIKTCCTKVSREMKMSMIILANTHGECSPRVMFVY